MRHSICIIDDTIPAASIPEIKDSELLNASNLQMLLVDGITWSENVVRNLVDTLLSQKDTDGVTSKWDVSGFTNPALYINALDNGTFRSDIIIYDWDYSGTGTGAGTDSESLLMEILEKTFCLIFIFSGADQKDQIDAILARPEFEAYKERVSYLDKTVGGVDQTNILVQRAEEMYANNFSFKFANTLRRRALQSMDKILSDMGKVSLNDIKNHIAMGDAGKKDLVDFLAERYRASVASKDIYDLVDQIPEPPPGTIPVQSLVEKVWSYRLYFQQETGDDLIRRGDIVKTGNDYSLVLSADCDLGYFWKKNLGIINMVAMHELDTTNATLKALLTLCVKPEKIPIPGRPSSLLGQIGDLAQGPFILPFIPSGDAVKNFVAVPKDMITDKIALPTEFDGLTEKEKSRIKVRYSHWAGVERVCTISEPFLTPVVHHILNAIGGNGVPDYPEHMTVILKKILDDFAAVPAAIPAVGAAVLAPATATEI